jgi:ABC-2 type transport system ATP-binding protein
MTPVLEVSRLQHTYRDAPVLRNVDLVVNRGEFVALIGANGSGKTTLLKCVAGLTRPRAGTVRVDGIDVAAEPARAKAKLGFAIEPQKLPPLLTGQECIRLFAEARGLDPAPPDTLELAQKLALTPMLEQAVAHYSLGTRQKLGIVLGLLGRPPLLILDEPLNGLDPMSAYALKNHLQHLTRDFGTAVILATHSLDVAERYITKAVLLMDGSVFRTWNVEEIQMIRGDAARSLEQEMVTALKAA